MANPICRESGRLRGPSSWPISRRTLSRARCPSRRGPRRFSKSGRSFCTPAKNQTRTACRRVCRESMRRRIRLRWFRCLEKPWSCTKPSASTARFLPTAASFRRQPSRQGCSPGKWQRDTLVVETTGFNGQTWLDQAGHPTTDALHLTERFHRRDFGHLDEQITIDDPKAYTRPWTITEHLNCSPTRNSSSSCAKTRGTWNI